MPSSCCQSPSSVTRQRAGLGARKATGSVAKKNHYLRRIPKDPMTNSYDWGLHSTRDDIDSQTWGGQNVYNVFTKSTDKARDGTAYSQW